MHAQILPLMVGMYVLFGGVAGGIFFEEFGSLGDGAGGATLRWTLYITGMVLAFGGRTQRVQSGHCPSSPPRPGCLRGSLIDGVHAIDSC